MTQQATFDPIVNLPASYVNNATIAYGSNTTLTVAPGQVRDSTNVNDLVLSASTTVNAAVNGINGLDTGSLAANKCYAVFIIADPTGVQVTGTIISLSATAPTLPFGYGLFRRIGWILTDASSHFLKFYQLGSGASNVRTYYYDSPVSVLSGGASATFAAVSLVNGVPAMNAAIFLNAAYTPAVAGNAASIRPTGSSVAANASPVILTGDVIAKAQDFSAIKTVALLATGVPSIDYVVQSSDALSLSVAGFEDFL